MSSRPPVHEYDAVVEVLLRVVVVGDDLVRGRATHAAFGGQERVELVGHAQGGRAGGLLIVRATLGGVLERPRLVLRLRRAAETVLQAQRERVAAAPVAAVGDALDDVREVGARVALILLPVTERPVLLPETVPVAAAHSLLLARERRGVARSLAAHIDRDTAARGVLQRAQLEPCVDDGRPARHLHIGEAQADDLLAAVRLDQLEEIAVHQHVVVVGGVGVGDVLLDVVRVLPDRHGDGDLGRGAAGTGAQRIVDVPYRVEDGAAAVRAVEPHQAGVEVGRLVHQVRERLLHPRHARRLATVPGAHRAGGVEDEQHVRVGVGARVRLPEVDLGVVGGGQSAPEHEGGARGGRHGGGQGGGQGGANPRYQRGRQRGGDGEPRCSHRRR